MNENLIRKKLKQLQNIFLGVTFNYKGKIRNLIAEKPTGNQINLSKSVSLIMDKCLSPDYIGKDTLFMEYSC